MRRRMYFLLPGVESAERTANDLLLARIEDRHMHFLARRGTDLGKLHEASILQKSDAVHGARLGMMLGAVGGIVVGTYVYLTPPENMPLEFGTTVLVLAVLGALFGMWASSLVALAVPNTRLKRFAEEIERGSVLLMVDVPPGRVDEIHELVRLRHPEAADHGLESTVPAFP
jgi:hypothetical protein